MAERDITHLTRHGRRPLAQRLSSLIGKSIGTLVVLLIAAAPTWIYLAARFLLAPHGFWQELALGLIGLWFLGSIQVLFAVIALLLVFSIWLSTD